MRRFTLQAVATGVVITAAQGVAAAQTEAQPGPATDPTPGSAGFLGMLALTAVLVVVAMASIALLRRGRRPKEHTNVGPALRKLMGVMDEAELGRAAAVTATLHTDAAGAVLLRTTGEGLRRLGPSEEPMATGLDVVVTSGQTLMHELADDPALTVGPVSVLAVPVVTTGQVVGVLAVHRPVDRPFGPSERHTLERLARGAAASLADLDHRGARQAYTLMDPVTALGNRRRLDRDLAATVAAGPGLGSRVALAHIAIDQGTGEPDAVVEPLSRTVAAHVRAGDVVYRSGDTEFTILLPGADQREAARVAERVRYAAERSADPRLTGCTLSIGVATADPASTVASLTAAAEAALHTAQRTGNCVTVA